MDYTPLRISTVKPLKSLTFDLYIHFKNHYLCYAKRGDQLTEDKYGKLKVQKFAKFFDQIALFCERMSNSQKKQMICSFAHFWKAT